MYSFNQKKKDKGRKRILFSFADKETDLPKVIQPINDRFWSRTHTFEIHHSFPVVTGEINLQKPKPNFVLVSMHLVASNKNPNSEWLKQKEHLLFYITRCPVVGRVMRFVDFTTQLCNKWPTFLPSFTLPNHSSILRLLLLTVTGWLLVSDRDTCFFIHIQCKIDYRQQSHRACN